MFSYIWATSVLKKGGWGERKKSWNSHKAMERGLIRVLEQAGIAQRICPGLCPGLQLKGQEERERTSRLPVQDKGLLRKSQGFSIPGRLTEVLGLFMHQVLYLLSPSLFLPGLTAIFSQRLQLGRLQKTRLGTIKP